MKSQHTPGPLTTSEAYAVEELQPLVEAGGYVYNIERDTENGGDAAVYGYALTQEDATLWVAAPELLAACNAALNAMGRVPDQYNLSAAMVKLTAAIAKAEGRAGFISAGLLPWLFLVSALLPVALLCGCGGFANVKTPCMISGATLTALPWQQTDNYCKAVLQAPEDPGVSPGYAEGCFRGKEIVFPLNWRVIKHELRHLLETQCPAGVR